MDSITSQIKEIAELLDKNKWGHTDKSVIVGSLYLFTIASLMESEEANSIGSRG